MTKSGEPKVSSHVGVLRAAQRPLRAHLVVFTPTVFQLEKLLIFFGYRDHKRFESIR